MAKNKANYTGRKFGLLKVIGCVEASTGSNKGGQWLCMCKCKRTITLGGYQLHHRNSCGCLGRRTAVERGKALRKTDEEKAIGIAYGQFRRMCKNEVFPLIKEHWLEAVKGPCRYCGYIDPIINTAVATDSDKFMVVCASCKKLKGQMEHNEFVEKVDQIHQHLSKK